MWPEKYGSQEAWHINFESSTEEEEIRFLQGQMASVLRRLELAEKDLHTMRDTIRSVDEYLVDFPEVINKVKDLFSEVFDEEVVFGA